MLLLHAPRVKSGEFSTDALRYAGVVATTRTIELRTEIPGPKGREIIERMNAALAAPLKLTFPVVAVEAHGVTITDADGNRFIDFSGGIGCLNVGHSHPQVVAAAQEQLERFSHTDFTIVPYEVYVDAGRAAARARSVHRSAKAAFFNSGAEAVENAVKFARSYTKRPAVIAFAGAFHGRTLMALSLTSKTHPYKAGLGPVRPRGLPLRLSRTSIAASRRRTRSPRSSRRCSTQIARRDRGRDRDRAGARRGRVRSRARRSSSRACGGSATSTGS